MFKKKDLTVLIVLFALTLAAVSFFILYRQSFSVGGVTASIDNPNSTIFVSLPEGSDTVQEVTFNFPFEEGYIFISRATGDNSKDGPSIKVKNGDKFDFLSFISHLKVETASGKLFDLWVTTGNVPIITIEAGKDIPDEPKVDCKASILSSNPGYSLSGIDCKVELTDISAEIPKSSYSLNIAEDPITGNIPQILDFSPSKRFRLSASYGDPSVLREKLAAEIFSIMGEPSLESSHAELYVNGSYQGLYLISRRIDRDTFSIPNYDPGDDFPGVIYEASGWRAGFSRGLEGFSQVEPDYDSETPYMGPLEELISLVMEAPGEEFLRTSYDTLDIENTLDSHILFLLSGCPDTRAANQYIYRENGGDSKFSFFPGSYYQGSFGRDRYSKKAGSGTSFYGTRLFNRLYDEASYREDLKARYNSLREDILKAENLSSLIDKNTTGLTDAWERNSSAWSISAPVYEDSMSPEEDIAYIKEYLGKRLAFLDEYINNPPIFKIGDSHALINEEANTIFCALPPGSDTVQEISWDCWDGAEVYIKPVSVGSYTAREEKDPQEMEEAFLKNSQTFKGGNLTGEITMWIDQPYEDETITDIVTLSGWALNQVSTEGTGVKNVFVFDGPGMDIDNFLGVAVYGNTREDVAEHFKNPVFDNSGYSLEIDTTLLKNGKHDLYVYAYDSKSNYSLQILKVEVYNGINLFEKDINMQKTQLGCNDNYNFVDYVFHGILEIRSGSLFKTYDLWVTTGDLPVVILDTGNTAIPNYPKIDCSFQLLSAVDLPNYSTEKIKSTIEVRGGSSAFSDKKSYSFKFDRELSYDVELSL
ncbi:MAG: CotH kinase family protein, partial [Actinobacteria bacterium]|nr:CotH kinase family protein [Actinomycetota bacterium]